MARQIVILGAGGHAGVILDSIEAALAEQKIIVESISFLDDNIPTGKSILGRKIQGKLEDCLKYSKETEFVIGIGDNKIRKETAERYPLNYITLIHPSAIISKSASLGKGTVVMANAVINCGTIMGEHCIVNTGATVDHDCWIEDFVHISPGSHLGGNVKVGKESWIGIGSSIKNGVEIYDNVVVGAGGVVVHDIIKSGIYVGIPTHLRSDK